MSDQKIKVLGFEWDFEKLKQIAGEELLKIRPDLAGEESETEFEKMINDMTNEMKRIGRAEEILNVLEIPNYGGKVDAAPLVAILMDETKLQKLVSMIKNKAFW